MDHETVSATEADPEIPSERGETQCMERMAEGDEAALAVYLERYWSPLAGFGARMLRDTEAGKDFAQEAFARLWEIRLRWVPRGSPRAFLYRVVRNLALQEMEKRGVRGRDDLGRLPEPAAVVGPAEEFAVRRLEDALESAIGALPPRRREIFVLARFRGLTYEEISDLLGISPQTVANQMSAALRQLRVELCDFLPETDPEPMSGSG
jgi:RNA polymerase sigma-70 factor, ECF subfamily